MRCFTTSNGTRTVLDAMSPAAAAAMWHSGVYLVSTRVDSVRFTYSYMAKKAAAAGADAATAGPKPAYKPFNIGVALIADVDADVDVAASCMRVLSVSSGKRTASTVKPATAPESNEIWKVRVAVSLSADSAGPSAVEAMRCKGGREFARRPHAGILGTPIAGGRRHGLGVIERGREARDEEERRKGVGTRRSDLCATRPRGGTFLRRHVLTYSTKGTITENPNSRRHIIALPHCLYVQLC
ncbi:unnamed protein product [Chondrus crispus]|uniref:Uncharacterized protein n=1 Tax=Chondrus crispus TaxID=2769 RepID=R7QIF1_CHOCR|nr:unnamed protein product [Chondrus crispus]CDF37508.1 unnamed protein product [Chondrus crispus]|eukprot:XP_005717379.1 unnamed protein product [Chondrus crispus]